MDEFVAFGLSFLFNAAVALGIVRTIYAPTRQDKSYALMLVAVNTLIFLISTLLGGIELSVGFGLSLFAVLSLLRFRTDPIPVREMTYLFVMMGLPVVHAVMIDEEAYATLLIADLALAGLLLLIEREWGLRKVGQKTILYERTEWIRPEHHATLLADLRARTGLEITGFEIGKIDFMHDTAEIKITYVEPEPVAGPEELPDHTGLFAAFRSRNSGR